MANIAKELYEDFQKQAAKKVLDQATGEPTSTTKGGVFTKGDIEAIKDAKAKKEIRSRYKSYVRAAKQFNTARDKMVAAKYNLQNALDKPFTLLQLVTTSKLWNILGLDPAENILYRDSVPDRKGVLRNYEDVFLTYKARTDKGSATVKSRDQNWDKAWDVLDKEIPRLETITPQDNPQDTPEDTPDDNNDTGEILPGNFDEDRTGYLASFRRKRKPETRLEFFRGDLIDEDQASFFHELTLREKRELYAQLNDEEKGRLNPEDTGGL